MHFLVKRLILLLFLVAIFGVRALSARPDDRKQQIETFVTKDVKPGDPGLAVLIKRNGALLFQRGFGVRRLGERDTITPDTNFRLASVTKQFTAMGIMLLVHDGKLRYETTLTEIFPGFPAYGKAITVRHLLTHTSGLPDYEELMDQEEKVHGPRWSPERQIQDDEVLALLKKETKGKFAPDTSWAYSNSGYVVLGLVIATVSGTSYGEYLRQHIFAPLRMDHTLVYLKGKNGVSLRAYGHSPEHGKFVVTDQSSTSATLGDGGIYSNLEDLSKWDDALNNHSLLPEREMQAALTPVKLGDGRKTHWPLEPGGDNLAPGKPVSYGFGWFLDSYQAHPRMWHSGSTMGFRNVIERFTADGLTVIVLCNRTDLQPESIALQIADLYLEKAK
jgi:CubicO group peptidase (beta-lactamase class C family)